MRGAAAARARSARGRRNSLPAGEPVVLWRSKRRRMHVLQEFHRLSKAPKEPLESLEPLEPLELPEAAGETDEPVAAAAEAAEAAAEAPRKRRHRESEEPSKPAKKRKAKGQQSTAEHEQGSAAEPERPAAPRQGAAPPTPVVPAAPSALLQLALRSVAASKFRKAPQPPAQPPKSPTPKAPKQPATPPKSAPPAAKLDAKAEIDRIFAAQEPDELLGLARGESDEDTISKAWKRLVLLLHPDKLQRLKPEDREAGAEALHRVHAAKDELRRRSQECCAQEPEAPKPAGMPKCLSAARGQRKYEFSWKIPETQDPSRPVEKYEVWGPRYFGDSGEPFEWTLLATLPPLQNTFIIVEEAPTQQDVIWAADRVMRRTLPLTVHAANGKGSSEPLTFELPWQSQFPWLRGVHSVLCTGCFKLQRQTGMWTPCTECGTACGDDTRLTIRCPDCAGCVLWSGAGLACTSCMRRFAQAPTNTKQPHMKWGAPVKQPPMAQRSWSQAGHQAQW